MTTIDRRVHLLGLARRLAWLTVSWNVVEGVIAIAAARASGSVALLGFGIDSGIESLSALVVLWRLSAERRHDDPEKIERAEHRARKLIAASLMILAAYICVDAVLALTRQEQPSASAVGLALTLVSLVVMLFLARAKRRVAVALGSRALEADSFQTTACWWLSMVTLTGLALNGLFGWWWADPLAALAMIPFIAREAKEAWSGEACDDDCC